MRYPSPGAALALVLGGLALAPAAHALVANGGFESGDLSGWTTAGDTSFIGVAEAVGRSGEYGAFFGPDPLGSIAQALATEPGAVYRVSFWLALDDSAVPNGFSWSWGGTTQGTLSDATAFDYVQYGGLVSAAGTGTTLQFSFGNPASFWRLDDVSVTLVPEPSAAALLALGLIAVAAVRRQRKEQQA